jgi:cyclopropane fatty-acyl-phospholipid synthase-like methyltransferase
MQLPAADLSKNVRTVRAHYDRLFDLVDRAKSYEAGGFSQKPPIVNMGFWTGGAKTAREAQEQLVRELVSRSPDLRGKRVLDAGCGLGGPAMLLASEYGAVVDGINIVERQVRWSSRFIHGNGQEGRIRVHIASAMDVPFRDASFDVVFCLEAAHCFADKARFLRECYRTLRPGGTLLLADITGTTHLPLVNWQPALGLNLITGADWERLLAAAGFEIREKTSIGNRVYPGCRGWAAKIAPERRNMIFAKNCSATSPRVIRKLLKLRAAILEFVYFRSVLTMLSALNLRDFVLFTAVKRDNMQ